MKARKVLLLGAVLLMVVCVGAISYDPLAPRSDWPLLKAATPAIGTSGIAVGSKVCVTAGEGGDFLYCTIAADPNDPKRLFTACLQSKGRNSNLVGFYSGDGGSTWILACERIATPKERRSDPSASFGPDGTAYLVAMRFDPESSEPLGSQGAQKIEFLASPDGKTWQERAVVPIFIDRPWLAVDSTRGPKHGRVYCVGNTDGLIFFHSDDGATSFAPPLDPIGHKILNCRVANPVITSNGTLLLVYEDRVIKTRRPGTRYRPQLHTLRSRDGGESFAEVSPVNTKWWHDTIMSSRVNGYFPQLAADPGSEKFAGRVYCVWTDGNSDLAERIFFSSSSDEGKTWTDAIVISEQPMEAGSSGEYMTFIPSIAVNRAGVVAVTWYDRRGLPPGQHVPIEGQPSVFRTEASGWNVRLRASLDGGHTWLPSVQINEQLGPGETDLGHAAGLAASPDGRFHAAWIDNRTGHDQLWTAAIEVKDTQ